MRSWEGAQDRAEYLSEHPNAAVKRGGLCQKVARDIVGASAFGGTAIIAWHNTPDKHKIKGQVVAGGLTYFDKPGVPDGKEFGHAVFAVRGGNVWSTDILRYGELDLVHYTVITKKWNMRLLGTINWTPSGAINMAPTINKPPATVLPTVSLRAAVAAATKDPHRAQGGTTAGSLDDVVRIERALVEVGLLGKRFVDGSFGTRTRTAYANWQRKTVGGPYDGIPGAKSLAALGRKTNNFKVGK